MPRGTSGEFQTRGYSVMLGYWTDPDRTSEAIDTEGWMPITGKVQKFKMRETSIEALGLDEAARVRSA